MHYFHPKSSYLKVIKIIIFILYREILAQRKKLSAHSTPSVLIIFEMIIVPTLFPTVVYDYCKRKALPKKAYSSHKQRGQKEFSLFY